MKIIKYINYIFVGMPILLILSGIITKQSSGNLIGYGLILILFTNVLQIILGIRFLIETPRDSKIQAYFVSLFLFFLMCFINAKILNSDIIYYFLMYIPTLLSIYFSTIIYKKRSL